MHTRIHGHRGARGRRPENTLPAIEYALRHAVDGVEVDLCVSKDNHLVLHHDLRLNPATTRDSKGRWIENPVPVCELLLNELRQYDVGRLKPGGKYAAKFPGQVPVDGAWPPTLDECAAVMRRHADESGIDGTVLNLELKSARPQPVLVPEPGRYVSLVLNKLEELRLSAHVLLQSFDWRLPRLLKQRQPCLKVGFTKAFSSNRLHSSADLMEITAAGGDVFSCDHRGLTKQMVDHAHDLGLEVYAWTVNEKPDIEKMAGWGVDTITTDYPARCRTTLYGAQ